ncbi:MAG: DUF3667 domain-containing protein [Pseudomonadota bacterium]
MEPAPSTQALPQCTNCDAGVQKAYCGVCGQRLREPRRLVIGLVQDVVVETLSVDGKLARTLTLLLRAPGRLAEAYLSGKRVRYTPPFRLYLFSSVLFFFAFFFLVSNTLNLAEAPDAPAAPAAGEDAAQGEARASPPGFFQGLEAAEGDVPDWFYAGLARMNLASQRLQEDPRLFFAQVRDRLPSTLLLAPLAYGGFLTILYVYRRRILIYDHLVVSLYMHAALYAYLTAVLALSLVPSIGWIANTGLLAWAAWQPFAVLRQAYRSNWVSVVVKGAILQAVYGMTVLLLISASLGLALYNS